VTKVFADIDISLDGFVAGEGISEENPLGAGGERLIWYGYEVNESDASLESVHGAVDAAVLRESMETEGAVIMGRRTFELSIESWGENPPIHKPCFVLTSRASAPITRAGGTSFTFVTDGPEAAVRLAGEAARNLDVGVMGGARTIRGMLASGLLDELRLHIVPVLLGRGLRLFDDEPGGGLVLNKVRALDGEKAVHLFLRPQRGDDTVGPNRARSGSRER